MTAKCQNVFRQSATLGGDFETLRRRITVGRDIGGFHGGDPDEIRSYGPDAEKIMTGYRAMPSNCR